MAGRSGDAKRGQSTSNQTSLCDRAESRVGAVAHLHIFTSLHLLNIFDCLRSIASNSSISIQCWESSKESTIKCLKKIRESEKFTAIEHNITHELFTVAAGTYTDLHFIVPTVTVSIFDNFSRNMRSLN